MEIILICRHFQWFEIVIWFSTDSSGFIPQLDFNESNLVNIISHWTSIVLWHFGFSTETENFQNSRTFNKYYRFKRKWVCSHLIYTIDKIKDEKLFVLLKRSTFEFNCSIWVCQWKYFYGFTGGVFAFNWNFEHDITQAIGIREAGGPAGRQEKAFW